MIARVPPGLAEKRRRALPDTGQAQATALAADERELLKGDLAVSPQPWLEALPETREALFQTTEPLPAAAGGIKAAALRFAVQTARQASGHLDQGVAMARHPARIGESFRSALREESAFGTPFNLVAVMLGVGALGYVSLAREPAWHVLGLLFGAVIAARVIMRRMRIVALMLNAAALIVVGMLAGRVETWRTDTGMMGSTVITRITGKLVHAERIGNGRTRFIIDLTNTERPTLKHAPERIRISAGGDHSQVMAGSTISGLVRLFALQGPVRPGGYDFAFAAHFDGFGAAGFFLGRPQTGPPQGPPDWRERLDRWRAALTARIRAAVPGGHGDVVAALVTGVRGPVSNADNEALRRSGLAHIMSISGLHLAMAAGGVMALLRILMALPAELSSRFPAKKIAATAGMAFAIAYCMLSGAEVAAVRSTIMIVVMLGAVLLDRPAITMRNLALAGILILIVHPHEISTPGFQMSFAATAALIAGYRLHVSRRDAAMLPDRSLFARAMRGMLAAAWLTIFSSLLAGTATGPFAIDHFERVAPWGVLANLLALPVVSLVVMPAAVAGMAALPIGLDTYIWQIMGAGVAALLAIAHGVAALPGPDSTGLVPTSVTLLLASALIVACFCVTRLRWLALVPVLAAGMVWIARPVPAAFVSEDFTLAAINAPQGVLCLSNPKPDRFAADNWQRSAKAETQRKPVENSGGGSGAPDPCFVCTDSVCTGSLPDMTPLIHVGKADAWPRGCMPGALMVQGWAGEPAQCAGAVVLTSGMMARHGSAMLFAEGASAQAQSNLAGIADVVAAASSKADHSNAGLETSLRNSAISRKRSDITFGEAVGRRLAPVTGFDGMAARYRVEWAFPTIDRPWQSQRIFSRAARDQAEPEPRPRQPKPQKGQEAAQGDPDKARPDRSLRENVVPNIAITDNNGSESNVADSNVTDSNVTESNGSESNESESNGSDNSAPRQPE
jgi:ComEC/Rec2-related protein